MFTIKISMKDESLIVVHNATVNLTPKGITVNDKFHYKLSKITKIEMVPVIVSLSYVGAPIKTYDIGELTK